MKMTLGEWQRYLNDDEYWANEISIDETLFMINGEEVHEVSPKLPNSTLIKIVEGIVFDSEMRPISSLAHHARRWRKKQGVREVSVQLPIEVTDAQLRAALKALGAKVVS